MLPSRTDKDVEAIAFVAGGERFLSLTATGKLQTWDVSTGMLLAERDFPIRKSLVCPAVHAAFASGGGSFAAPSRHDPCVVKRWDTSSGDEISTFRGHPSPVCCVRFSPDGRCLATCSCGPEDIGARHEVRVWDAATGELLANVIGTGRLFNLAFGLGGHLLSWSGRERDCLSVGLGGYANRHQLCGSQG